MKNDDWIEEYAKEETEKIINYFLTSKDHDGLKEWAAELQRAHLVCLEQIKRPWGLLFLSIKWRVRWWLYKMRVKNADNS